MPTAFQPPFTLTPLLQRQLKAIDEARGFLEAVRLQGDWHDTLRGQRRVQDALSSVQIEGNSLTYDQAFVLAQGEPDRDLRDSEREFLNYLRAFEAIDGLCGRKEVRLTRADLLNLHRILLQGVRGGQRFSGQLRREQVSVGDRVDGEIVVHHQPPTWGEVEALVDDLFQWIDAVKQHPTRRQLTKGAEDLWLHPVLAAGIAQHRMVWIHPFVDGNGRSARMLTTMLLYLRGYDFKGLFDLSTYYEQNRDAYYEALRTADATGDYTRWLEYFTGGFAMQMFAIKAVAAKHAAGVTAPEPEAVTAGEA
jgi:Fic family protein